MPKQFIKGSDELKGILCYIKSYLEFDIFSKQTWVGDDPSLCICVMPSHNVYPEPSYPNNYVSFTFDGFFIQPHHFVIQ